MLNITEDRIREVYAEFKLPILHLSLVNDVATHEKFNVITQIHGTRIASFIWDEESLMREAVAHDDERGKISSKLKLLQFNLNRSTMLQSPRLH